MPPKSSSPSRPNFPPGQCLQQGAPNEGVVVAEARIARDTSGVLLRLVLPQMARPGRPTGHPQNFFTVVDDDGAEAAGGVDIGVGDGDGGEVDHEDSKPKGLWNQDMDVRISSASLGISGWKKKKQCMRG